VSGKLLDIVKLFLADEISAEKFVDRYQKRWKIERDNHLLQKDNDSLSECLSSVFCAADMYESDFDREEYEFDETALKEEVARLVDKHSK